MILFVLGVSEYLEMDRKVAVRELLLNTGRFEGNTRSIKVSKSIRGDTNMSNVYGA